MKKVHLKLPMSFVILFFFFSVFLSVNVAAGDLITFSSTGDYRGTKPFQESTIALPVPTEVDSSWFSLSSLTQYLPLSYSLNSASNTVTITNTVSQTEGNLLASRSFSLNGSWDSALVRSGAEIYISPKLVQILCNEQILNLMDGKIYLHSSLADASTPYIVNPANSAGFAEKVNCCLYALWKKAPQDYQFTTSTLGKISSTQDDPSNGSAIAFVYTGDNTCYILQPNLPTLRLASVIAHEAEHVDYFKHYTGSEDVYIEKSEQAAQKYGNDVYQKLLSSI